MKKGYFVAKVDVTDREGYAQYLEAGAGLVDSAGGCKLVVPRSLHRGAPTPDPLIRILGHVGRGRRRRSLTPADLAIRGT